MKHSIIILNIVFTLLIFEGCQAQTNQELPSSLEPTISIEAIQNEKDPTPLLSLSQEGSSSNLDFRKPAKKVMPGVVHILSTYEGKVIPQREFDLPEEFKDFFGENFQFFRDIPQQLPNPRVGSGSGVILTPDGYLLTNNHVIMDSDNIEIILHDNRSFKAEVKGTDPATDLALLKIDEQDLDFVKFGNSDQLEIGEWVLAVGNPFNFSTTVTAGIVSAKARNLNIIKDQASIESFIQTDAVVNRGNSGGALVNLNGELIGINTAIASPTGIYAGYSFAIPSNIAKKVVDDLLNFGEVQRAYLGVYIRTLDSKTAKELKLNTTVGIVVDSIVEKGAAEEAGLRKNDVIIKIDGEELASSPALQEVIGRHRPNDKIKVTLLRKGKEEDIQVVLKAKMGEERIIKKDRKEILENLGIEIENLTSSERKKWQLQGGIKITKINNGIILKNTAIKKGFIVSKLNNQTITSVDDFIEKLESTEGGIMLEGFYSKNPDMIFYYAFGL